MKTSVKKIILLTAALMFFGAGISFARDGHNRSPGHAYGHYKHQGQPAWHKKQPGPGWRHNKKDAPRYVRRHYRDYGHYGRGRGHDGSVLKFSVADQNVAFKIMVKDFERR